MGYGVPFTESKHTDEGEMTCMIQANVGMYEHLKYVPAMYPIHHFQNPSSKVSGAWLPLLG